MNAFDVSMNGLSMATKFLFKLF